MRYCFNPNCSSPENSDETEICQTCHAGLLLKFQVGEDVQIQIQGQELIGQGGFGRTLLAMNAAEPHQKCVVKQLLPQGTSAAKASELFYQEAEKLKVLGKHPQIPDWIAHFEQDGYQYLVQEFIEGKNLAQELAEKGVFNESQIRKLLKDLLPVLRFIHSHKIIHRDIKPANIIRRSVTQQNIWESSVSADDSLLLNRRSRKVGQLVLVDFGAAKLVTQSGLPQTGTLIGSAAYTAPEQLMGKAVFASDIYSLGVTCIHLLTQISPFDLFDSHEGIWTWRDYLQQPISEDLGHILDTMLAGATNRRYHSAAAVLKQLSPRSNYVKPRPIIVDSDSSNLMKTPLSDHIPVISAELGELQEKLQNTLQIYHVKIQVNQAKTTLKIVISRDENIVVDYAYLAGIIVKKLTPVHLKNIINVKLIGRVENESVPEWQRLLRANVEPQVKKNLMDYSSRIFSKLEPLITQEFWLTKSQSKSFWIDVLMFLGVFFIFTAQVIVFHPFWAGFIATGFIVVKHLNQRRHPLNTQKLFYTLITICLTLGLLGLNAFWITNTFGLFLACLFIALPALYVEDSDHPR